MKSVRTLITSLAALALASCGYHLGGIKPAELRDMNTFAVDVFDNETVYPNAGMLMTTAMANSLQSDGTYRMAPRNEADFIVEGCVKRVQRETILTDSEDTYISKELGARVYVVYKVTNRKTGEVIFSGEEEEMANFFNQIGSSQSAQEAALSYATRKIADDITLILIAG